MSLEVTSEKSICSKCGTAYGRRKGYFPVSYADLHKGIGYIPVCKDCIDKMYNVYLSQCNDAKKAVRQVCRKLDLYWNDEVFDLVSKKSTTRSMMTQYIAKINTVKYAGKSYDDTLLYEGDFWNFCSRDKKSDLDIKDIEISKSEETQDVSSIPEDVIAFWGQGYSPSMYEELEKKRQYYTSRLPNDKELDIGSEILIKQVCNLEVNIAKDSAAGKSIDKNVNSLNTLIGSLNLKPVQMQDDSDAEWTNTPMGVWLYRYEHKRPLPEIDDDLKDVNKTKKYVFTWLGHVCKMLGKKNGFSKLYEDEINKYRVERPEFSDEDDEEMVIDILSESEEDEDI